MDGAKAEPEDTTAHLTIEATPKEISRHQLADSRYPMIRLYLDGKISAANAAMAIGLKRAAFYKLAKRALGSKNYHCIVPRKTGRPLGAVAQEASIEILIDNMIDKHFKGKAATYAHVWKQCQVEADKRHITRPGYPTVRRRIKALGKREEDLRKYGADFVNEKYGPKPGYKETSRPLEWVQIDHTVVDLIIVDEATRKVIGRPWLSLAICLHTRVVLGFYLSLLPPSAVTVAMLVECCVLPKDRLLASLNLPGDFWPMHGMVETFHADNAKEFISDVFELNLSSYGVKVEHRLVGKKHQGGHIESLIGKMMTRTVHFLRGTTYSNTVQRRGQNSEKKASLSFSELKYIIVCSIRAYHETKHSGIGMSPMRKWDEHYSSNPPARTIPSEDHEVFRYLMYPEVGEKYIGDNGIQFKKRVYYSSAIKDYITEKVLIKFDPYDLTYLMVRVKGKFLRIPCVRNSLNRSENWEMLRHQIQQKGERNGTISKAGTVAVQLANERHEQGIAKTAAAKREEKRRNKKEAGVKHHKQHVDEVSGSGLSERESLTRAQSSENHGNPKNQSKESAKKTYNFKAPGRLESSKRSTKSTSAELDLSSILKTDIGAVFSEDIVLYD